MALSAGYSWMGGCRGARGARAVFRDGGIRRTSPELAVADGEEAREER